MMCLVTIFIALYLYCMAFRLFTFKRLWLGLLFVFAAASVVAQEDYAICKIDFEGNRHFSKSELLVQTSLKEVNLFQRWVQKQKPVAYHKEFVDQDLSRLVRFYQSEGFLFATVRLGNLETNDKKRQVRLRIIVEENRPVVLRHILFDIRDSLSTGKTDSLRQAVARKISLHTGKRFRDALVYSDLTAINQACYNRGYVYAKSDFRITVHPDSAQADMTFIIRPGKRCQFGPTTIDGNRYVKEKLIRRQIDYKEGLRYSMLSVDKTRQYLYNLQLFRVVSVVSEKDNATQLNPVPMSIHIQELPRWSSKFGVGYGTEERFRAFADVTYRSIGGGTSRLNLNVKYSYLDPYYINLKWIYPQFLSRKLTLSINPYIRRRNEPGFTLNTFGVNVPVVYAFNNALSLTVSYYRERAKLFVPISIIDLMNKDNSVEYTESGINTTLAYKTAMPVFNPDRGISLALGVKLNGTIFGSTFNYSKLQVDFRKYQTLGAGFVIAARVMAGSIPSFDKDVYIPEEERFYSGGSNSVRGWGYSKLGPKSDDGTPEGGASIMEMNVEMRRHLFWRLDGALFTDAGNVWTDSFHYPLNALAYSVGAGLRMDTPIGPVRIDVAMPVWNQKRSLQFFINVGQAF